MYGFSPYSTLPYSDVSLGAEDVYVELSGVPLTVSLGTAGVRGIAHVTPAGVQLHVDLGTVLGYAGTKVVVAPLQSLHVDLNIVQVKASAAITVAGLPLVLDLEGVTTSTSNRIPVSGFELVVSLDTTTVTATANVFAFGVEVRVWVTAPIVWSPATEDVDTPWTPIIHVPDCDMWAPIENEPDCDWAPIENEPDCDMWAPIENEPDCEKWAEVPT